MLPHDVDASSAGGGTAWRITAVLEFEPADTAAILALAKSKPAPEAEPIGSAGWFPDAVRAAMEAHPSVPYDASAFYAGIYQRGLLAHVEGTDYFLLRLDSD
jgi:hypothetical protein